jgi:hypothetical protein
MWMLRTVILRKIHFSSQPSTHALASSLRARKPSVINLSAAAIDRKNVSQLLL